MFLRRFIFLQATPQRMLAWYQILSGLMGLLLLWATLPLWLPQEKFPQVPLVNSLALLGSPANWPSVIDCVGLAMMTAGFAFMIIAPLTAAVSGRSRFFCDRIRHGILLFAAGFLISVIINQHRLQPWAFQFLALSLVFSGKSRFRLPLARCLVVGIYFWSAVGKFDYQFAYTVGSEMLAVPAKWFGFEIERVNRDSLALYALTLPVAELFVALLLCRQRTSRLGTVLAIGMHGVLLLVLGPFGLNHRPGVLLWNLFSLLQAWLLFGANTVVAATGVSSNEMDLERNASPQPGLPICSTMLIGAMLILPIVERWGLYDHWPAWALYAPHSSRVTLLVPRNDLNQLPESLRNLISDSGDGQLYVDVPLSRWSLEQLRAPIYPQSRFQLGVAQAIVQRSRLEREARVILRGPASRLRGERNSETLIGIHEIKKAGERYWFNAQPAMNRWKVKK